MAKKLADIKSVVDSSGEKFDTYLKTVLDEEVFLVIKKISLKTGLFIFSGVIRNFFLGLSEVRDIDIVISEDIDLQTIFKDFEVKKNSFGGYKIKIGKTNMDLWSLRNTWAIKQVGKPIDFTLDQYIPYTAFFNFSAIVYSFNERKFFYHSAFLGFLRDKKINYVYRPNANPTLCIINTLYYSDKFNLSIAPKLMRYVIEMFKSGRKDYERVQKKHFGKILYDEGEISKRIEALLAVLERTRKQKKNVKSSIDSLILMTLLLNPNGK